MIVSEAILIGLFSGVLSTSAVYVVPRVISWLNKQADGNVTFFDNIRPSYVIIIGGTILGLLIAIVGAALPSWNARKVKVSEVFAQVA